MKTPDPRPTRTPVRPIAAALLAAAAAVSLAACGEDAPQARDPDAARLIEQLETGNPSERVDAIERLAEATDPAIIPPLLDAAANDNQTQVRLAAIRALDRPALLADPAPLLALLDDPGEEIRLAVAEVLPAYDQPAVAEALTARLKDDAVVVRLAAIRSLGRLDSADEAPLRDLLRHGAVEERVTVLDTVGRVGDHAFLPGVIEALSADHGEVRRAAAQAAGLLGDPAAVGPLLDLLRGPVSDAERAAVDARLAAGPQPVDIRAIARAMDRQDVSDGNRPPPNRLQRLLAENPKQLRKPFEQMVRRRHGAAAQAVRDAAASALQKIGGPEATDALLALVGDEDPGVAQAAGRAVAAMSDDTEALTELARATDRPTGARVRVLGMLKQHHDRVAEEQRLAAALRGGAAPEADSGTPGYVALLNSLLDDEDRRVRAEAARHLAEVGGEDATPVLIELSRGEDADTADAAILGLVAVDDPAVVGRLIELLKPDAAAGHDKQIIQALGRIGDPAAVKPLAGVLRDDGRRRDLRITAAQALGEIGDPAAGAAIVEQWRANDAALARAEERDEQRSLNWFNHHLVIAMGDVRATEATDLLLERLEQDGGNAQNEMQALGKIGDPRAIDPIIRIVERGDHRFKRHRNFVTEAGVPALGRLGGDKALAALDRLVHNPPRADVANNSTYTQGLVLRTLATMEDPAAARQLVGYLADPEVPLGLKETAVAPAVVQAGQRAVEPLAALMKTDDYDEEADPGVYAAQLLAVIDAGTAADRFAEAIEGDANKPTLRRVVIGLETLESPRAAPLLIDLLSHDDAEVKRWAAVALGKRGEQEAVPALETLAGSDQQEEAQWARWAIERIRG